MLIADDRSSCSFVVVVVVVVYNWTLKSCSFFGSDGALNSNASRSINGWTLFPLPSQFTHMAKKYILYIYIYGSNCFCSFALLKTTISFIYPFSSPSPTILHSLIRSLPSNYDCWPQSGHFWLYVRIKSCQWPFKFEGAILIRDYLSALFFILFFIIFHHHHHLLLLQPCGTVHWQWTIFTYYFFINVVFLFLIPNDYRSMFSMSSWPKEKFFI